MGDTKDDVKYAPSPYSTNHQEDYGSSHGQKLAVRNAAYSGNRYVDDEEEDDYEEDLGEEEDDDAGDGQSNGVHRTVKVLGSDDDDDSDEDDEDDRDDKQKGFDRRVDDDDDLARHTKKRKLKSLISSYEFAPRVPPPPPPQPPQPTTTATAQKPSSGGRNSLTDWTERETFVLLDAWGDRFLQRGRKSLRFEEWQEVVEKVSEVSKIERTDTQCRNRLDTLKKKYKKEKMKIAETSVASKWVYFKKMDVLMSSPPQQGLPLSCGLDSGGYVFVSPRAYLNRANGPDQMRDSPPDDSESTEGDNDSDGLPPKKRKSGRDNEEGSSFRMLADCIHKFSEIYEKIESSKRKQMVELEKMRMEFQRDLEMQKRQIMERAQAEIAKIRQAEEEEEENASG